jgi:predicted N-acetyltransferase YhbS
VIVRDERQEDREPVVLLGHVEYYTRFGFRPAAPEGITNAGQQEGGGATGGARADDGDPTHG